MPNEPSNNKLGDLLLKGKIITEEQLANATREHRVTGGKFGSIITRLGYSTEKNIIFFLYRKIFVKKKNRAINYNLEQELGELLVRHRIISPKDLIEALKHQKEKNIKLGYALSELNIIDEKSLLDGLSEQLFNSSKTFTGKGNDEEENSDVYLSQTQKSIYASSLIFAFLLLVIIAVPTWYYFDTPKRVPANNTVKNNSETNQPKALKTSPQKMAKQPPTNDTKATKETTKQETPFIIASIEPEKKILEEKYSTEKIREQLKRVIATKKAIQEKINKPLKPPVKEALNTAFMNTPAVAENKPVIKKSLEKPPISKQPVKPTTKQPVTPTSKQLAAKVATPISKKVIAKNEAVNNKNSIKIHQIRYFSDANIAKFVFDSDKSLNNAFKRTYQKNQNMLFEFENSQFENIAIKNGHSDKIIENFSIKKSKDGNAFIMRYHMVYPGTSLYHILPPNATTPFYRLAITVRPKK